MTYVSSQDREDIARLREEIAFKKLSCALDDADLRKIANEVFLPVSFVRDIVAEMDEADYDRAAARSVGREY